MTDLRRGIPHSTWDDCQREIGGNVLQGRPWATFQAALGWEPIWSRGPGWSWIGFVTHGRGTRFLYAPYGPTAVDASSLALALDSMKVAAAEQSLDFVRCEPVGVKAADLSGMNLLPVTDVQPRHTRLLDLSPDITELRHRMQSGHRNGINGAARRGLEFLTTASPDRIDDFIRMISMTTGQLGFRSHEPSYFRTMLEILMPIGGARLGLAEHEGRVVAATIALDYNDTRSYAHAGADPSARKLRAAVPLVWSLIEEAKSEGKHYFDFWGVAPPDAPSNHPWAGFSEFKRAFGGWDVSYAGTWEIPVKRWKYPLYRLAKRVMT